MDCIIFQSVGERKKKNHGSFFEEVGFEMPFKSTNGTVQINVEI